jgi:RimJ/RimL family protein N-acetyltransferase
MSNNGADPMWTHTPTLEARGVALRPLRSEDAAAILDASADGELWTLFYTAAPGPHSLDAWMARAAQEHDAGRSLPFAVLRDGKIVGSTRMMRMNPRHRRLEIGTTFYAASVQRTYVNTQAKRLLLEYAFERLDCLSVQFRTDWFNPAPSRTACSGIIRSWRTAASGIRSATASSRTSGRASDSISTSCCAPPGRRMRTANRTVRTRSEARGRGLCAERLPGRGAGWGRALLQEWDEGRLLVVRNLMINLVSRN